MPFRAAVAAVLLVLGACSSAYAETQQFRAWTVTCGGGLCAAETPAQGGRITLRLQLPEQPNAPLTLMITNIGRAVSGDGPLVLSVDGVPPVLFGMDAGFVVEDENVVIVDDAQTQRLLPLFRNGNYASASFSHVRGTQRRLLFSLVGFSAALTHLLAQQPGAAGLASAEGEQPPPPQADAPRPEAAPEQDRAAAPAPETPAAEQPPEKHAAAPDEPARAEQKKEDVAPSTVDKVPAAVERLHKADGECRDYDESHLRDARLGGSLDEHRKVYVLPCYTGAYNLVSRIYVTDSRYPDEVKRELFAAYSDEFGWIGKDYLINPSYNAEKKRLTALEKSRGLGDCGSEAAYSWQENGWRLDEFRSWDTCDGTHMPDKWPVIFKHPNAD